MHSFLRRLFPARRLAVRPTGLRVERLDDRINPALSLAHYQGETPGGASQWVQIADFNSDGKDDLVGNDFASDSFLVQLNATAGGATTPAFGQPVSFATDVRMYSSVLTGDFNGDGRVDLAYSGYDSSGSRDAVTVLLNATPGGASVPSFAPPQQLAVSEHSFLNVADFNSDGRMDVLLHGGVEELELSVLLNDTAAGSSTVSFASPQGLEEGPGTVALVDDVNGDGRPDLTFAHYTGHLVSVHLNTAGVGSMTSSFSVGTPFACPGPFELAAGDINADGRPDLVVSSADPSQPGPLVLVLFNTGTATAVSFAAPQTVFVGNLSGLAVVDLDGDSSPELLGRVYTPAGETVAVFRNTTAAGALVASFEGRKSYSVGNAPAPLAFADLDLDGRTDVVVPHVNLLPTGNPPVAVLLNRSTPTFAAPRAFPTGAGATAVATADFNGDGRTDAVTANDIGLTGGTLSVLTNTTSFGAAVPTLATPQALIAGRTPSGVATADFNGDGRPDIVAANSQNYTVSVFRNTTPLNAAAPTFAGPQTFSVGMVSNAVAVGDFNGDGRPDIATVNTQSGTLSVLLNTTPIGSAVLSFAAPQIFYAGYGTTALAVGDFNGDNRPDVAVTNSTAGTVLVLRNTIAYGAPAVFGYETFSFAAGTGATSLAAGDVNGDGRPDLVANSAGGVVVLLNTTPVNGLPSFAAPQTFAAGNGLGAVALEDFDGDGRLDISVVAATSQVVAVLMNRTAPGAGAIAVAPKQAFALGTGPAGLATGDFNGDGRPDLITTVSGTSVSVLPNTAAGAFVPAASLVGQFGTTGVWGFHRATNAWTQLTGANASALAAARNGDVVAVLAGHGVWHYRPTRGWVRIHTLDATAIGIDALGNAYASFAGFGTYVYRLAAGSWTRLTGSVADKLAVGGNGNVVANFGSYGVYRYRPTAGWGSLATPNATALAIGENGDIAANFGAYGVYRFKAGTWSLINANPATALAVGSNGSVVASFGSYGIAKYLPSVNGWQSLHAGTPAPSVAMDLYGNVFATLGGFGVYEFNPFAGWRLRRNVPAGLLGLA